MPVTITLTKILTKFAFIVQLMLYYLNSDSAKFTMSVFNQVLPYVEMSGMANLVHFLIPIASYLVLTCKFVLGTGYSFKAIWVYSDFFFHPKVH